MDQFKFLNKIDSLKGRIPDNEVIELYDNAEEVFGNFKDEIRYLERENENLKEENEELEDQIDDNQDEIADFQSRDIFQIQPHNQNIVMMSLLEEFFNNLDFIPKSEIESLINKYKP